MLLVGAVAEAQEYQASGTGALAVVEDGDALAGLAVLRIQGSLSITETGDFLVATALPPIAGDVTRTEADDTLTATAQELAPLFAALEQSEAADTLVAAGAKLDPIAGTLGVIEAADTLAAAGVYVGPVVGALAVTEASDSIVAAGMQVVPIVGTLSVMEAGDTIASTGLQLTTITGTLTATEDADTLASIGLAIVPPVVMDQGSTIGGSTAWNLTGTVDTEVGDIILVTFFNPNNTSTVTSVTGVGCAAFAQRGTRQNNMEVWWGRATSANANVDITINTTSAAASQQPSWLLIRGVGTPATPFDPNAAFPAVTAGNNGSYTTDNPGDLLIFGGFNTSSFTPPAPTGFTTHVNNNWFNTASTRLSSKQVTATQSGVTASTSGATFNYVDALTGTA